MITTSLLQSSLLFYSSSIAITAAFPVAWYKLNSNTLDSSGNGNDGTLVNSSLYVTGQNGVPGDAMFFSGQVGNGADNFPYIDVPESSTIDTLTKLSMCFWFNTSASVSGPFANKNIISRVFYDGSGHTGDPFVGIYGMHLNNGQASALIDNSISVTSVSSLNDGNWHFTVATWDSTGDGYVRLYTDGVFDSISSGTQLTAITTPTPTTDLFIGGAPELTNFAYVGVLDDVRLYNVALTPSQISALYSLGAQ